MTGFGVDLAELGGYAGAVGRCGSNLSDAHGYSTSYITDGDFGAILQLITGAYDRVIPKFESVLQEDGSRLTQSGRALDESRRLYVETDRRVAQSYGIGAAITDEGPARGFGSLGVYGPLVPPTSGGAQLPEVSFGGIFDKVCDLIVSLGGPDIRRDVTKWIAGDIGKAALQASAWAALGEFVDSIETDLRSAHNRIDGTWTGPAATRAGKSISQWETSLKDQSRSMSKMSTYLRRMIKEAVDMAQVVVDIIKTIISIVSSAISSAYIPGWGEWKAVKTVKEAIGLINKARKVISEFWNALNLIKASIEMVEDSFSVGALPAVPSGG